MRRLVGAFAGRTHHIVGNIMPRLICIFYFKPRLLFVKSLECEKHCVKIDVDKAFSIFSRAKPFVQFSKTAYWKHQHDFSLSFFIYSKFIWLSFKWSGTVYASMVKSIVRNGQWSFNEFSIPTPVA